MGLWIRGAGYAEPYFAGLLAAVLSAPCTGPFLGGVLAFALTQSPAAIVAIFLAVGVGLALPYLVLLARPGLVEKLPRGGAWLLRIHQLLGLILLAGAAFFAATVLPDYAAPLLWSGWAGMFTFWALRALCLGPGLGARLVPGLVLAGTTVSVLAAWPQPVTDPHQALAWQPLTAQRLQHARAIGRPVLIEFTAEWCINCRVLEQTVYRDVRVTEAVRDAQALVLDRQGRLHERLPDLFAADTLVAALRHAGGNR